MRALQLTLDMSQLFGTERPGTVRLLLAIGRAP
jgi:hypothetical protein